MATARWIEWLGGRKATLSLVVLALGTVALWYGRLEGTQWTIMVGTVLAAFSAGNAAEHLATRPRAVEGTDDEPG